MLFDRAAAPGQQLPLRCDLDIAKRRIFWVAAVAGIIVFGTLALGTSMYIGQQFHRTSSGYNPLAAGASVIPMSVAMVAVASLSRADGRGSGLTTDTDGQRGWM